MSATTFAKDQLKAFVERVERLEEEKKAIADDIRDLYAEAKSNGFDTKALREIVKLRKVDADERREREAVLETYMHALGMLATADLGGAALARKRSELEAEGRRLIDEMPGASDAVRRAAASPAVRKAVKQLGTPVELTDDERAKGCTAAFVKGDTRMTIGVGIPKPPRAAPLAALPDDNVITETIPIPAQPIRSANQAGIGPAPPHVPGKLDHECTDGAGPSLSESVPDDTPTASNSSAPPRERLDFGGADDLSIPGFLKRTADNRVPA